MLFLSDFSAIVERRLMQVAAESFAMSRSNRDVIVTSQLKESFFILFYCFWCLHGTFMVSLNVN